MVMAFDWPSPALRPMGIDIVADAALPPGVSWSPSPRGSPIYMHPRDYLLLRIQIDVRPYARSCAMSEIVRFRHRRGLPLPTFEALSVRI